MKGFIYRTGVRIKETGERLGLPWLVRLGYLVRGFAARGRGYERR